MDTINVRTDSLTYLHVPKTGGTCLQNVVKVLGYNCFEVKNLVYTLDMITTNVLFVVRDPLERFCSGYWDAKRSEEYSQEWKNNPQWFTTKPPKYTYRDIEKEIFSSSKSPDEFITLLRDNADLLNRLWRNFKKESPFERHTRELTHWLGELPKYKTLEHKVKHAVDIKSLDIYMFENYNVKMPTDKFARRSTDQKCEVSHTNRQWFYEFRKKDHELVDYIKGREYYYER